MTPLFLFNPCGSNSPQLAVELIFFPKTVIPACFKRESRRNSDWTSIKTFGGDAFGTILIAFYCYPAASCGVVH
jgi:hypothetical protein